MESEMCEPGIVHFRNSKEHTRVSRDERNSHRRCLDGKKDGKTHPVSEEESKVSDDDTPVIQMFRKFTAELDNKHDKAERIVKHSRDITIESKRIIFLLHTIDNCDHKKESVLNEAAKRLDKLRQTNFHNIAQELSDEDAYQFLRSYTFGLQEYIEALTFYHYLQSGHLVCWEDVQKGLEYQQNVKSGFNEISQGTKDESNELKHESRTQKEATQNKVLVTPVDYVLGIADLTGELMRKCITNVSLGMIESCYQTCAFVRQIHSALLSVNGGGSRELSRKMSVLRSSLSKMETACYTIHVRGSEIPKHMIADVLSGEAVCPIEETLY